MTTLFGAVYYHTCLVNLVVNDEVENSLSGWWLYCHRVVMLDEILLWMFARARISYLNCCVGVPEMGMHNC